MKAILLFGHGARDPEWVRPFHRIRDAILARDPGALVEAAFLELMSPTLDEAIDGLAGRGVREIDIVPVFVSGGRHVNRDLPQRVADALERHPQLTVSIATPVGEAPAVIDAIAGYALAPVFDPDRNRKA